MKKFIPFLVCLLALVSASASARIIGVPGDSPTIQAGIDASTPGDTVLVQPGRYLETIDFKGKDIVLGSLYITTQDTSYISKTIIDGNKKGMVVTFKTYETEKAELCGFTVTGGEGKGPLGADDQGGGIGCFRASPRLHYLRVIGNKAPMMGGGIFCLYANSVIDHVVIENNMSSGGSIYFSKGNHKISNSVIKDNSGVGIVITENSMVSCYSLLLLHNSQEAIITAVSNVDILNCTITGHDNDTLKISQSNVNIINSIFLNDYPGIGEIFIYDGQQGVPISRVTVAFSDIKGSKDRIKYDYKDQLIWKEGNIDKAPFFNNDYTLNLMSPCIDAGTPFYQVNDSTIIELNKNEYHGNAPDMGAFESSYTQTEVQTIKESDVELSAFPNPFNLTSSIMFEISKASEINMSVYSITGQKIKEIVSGYLSSGKHRYQWHGEDMFGGKVASGTYFVRLKYGMRTQTARVVLLK